MGAYIGAMQRLYRVFARLAALLLVCLPIATQAEDAAPSPSVRPALWKVADEDTTIYLFGTVHVLPAGIDWYHGEVAKAFEGSQELVTEIVDADGSANKSAMTQKAALPAGQSLRGMMAPDERTRYEAALASLGLPPRAFDACEPWLAAMILSVAPLAKDGFAPANGVDVALSSRAKERGLKHEGLETYDFQLSLFDSLPMDTQKGYLSQVVKDLPTVRQEIDKMITAWKHGDADALAKLMNAGEDYPGMFETLLANRNRAWALWVKERMKQPGTVFVAVGAGHLAGPASLQEQLSAQGIASARVQ
jgi:uncharacterized protein YbaP (TraB family)